jgi:transcriptional regulator with XRE-family HTH domain
MEEPFAEETFAQFFKKRREFLGLTQKQVASNLEVPQGMISAWETGVQTPHAKAQTIQKIATALNVSPEDIQTFLERGRRKDQKRRTQIRPQEEYVTSKTASLLIAIAQAGFLLSPDLIRFIATHEELFVKDEQAPRPDEVIKLLKIVERHNITTTVPDVLLRFRS